MRSFPFATVDVFTEQRFGGNPLAVITDARGLSDAEMQSLAFEFGYSETSFVLPPDDPANSARVRIFTPAREMPFAGHPNVGTGFILAALGGGDSLVFEEVAGLVEVTIERREDGALAGARIMAPQPLSTGRELPAPDIATCVGLAPSDIVERSHPPLMASVGASFVMVEVRPGALARAVPDTAAHRQLDAVAGLQGRLAIHLYCQGGDGRVRTRMFAPLAGVREDPATGSANAALAALLLSLGRETRQDFEVTQGVEMGRPSVLRVTAHRCPDGIRASVGGPCVPVLRGEATL